MTDFERIESELLRLGYKEEQGKGDHMKFTKEGLRRPITISLGISGRSYQNAISNIRQVEPDFRLGKNAKSKFRQRADAIHKSVMDMGDDEKGAAQKYKFICPGMEVRYTSPENRDYSRLDDPTALMSHRFVVKELKTSSGRSYITSPDDKVVILNMDLSQEVTVSPDDIDMWKTKTCPSCGRELPLNLFPFQRLGDESGDTPCFECAAVSEKLLADFKNSEETRDYNLDEFLQRDSIFSEELEKEYMKYGGIPIGNLPIELQKRILVEVKEAIRAIKDSKGTGKKVAASLEKKLNVIANGLVVEEDKAVKKPSIYDCWKEFKKMAAVSIDAVLIADDKSKKERQDFMKRFTATTYALSKFGDIQVVTVSTNYEDVASAILLRTPMLCSYLDGYFGDTLWTLKLRCPPVKFEQYIPSFERAKAACKVLKSQLSETTFASQCEKLSKMSILPGPNEIKDTVGDVICQWMNEKGFEALSEYIRVDSNYTACCPRRGIVEVLSPDNLIVATSSIRADDISGGENVARMCACMIEDADKISDSIVSRLQCDAIEIMVLPYSKMAGGLEALTQDYKKDFLIHEANIPENDVMQDVVVSLCVSSLARLRAFADDCGYGSIDEAIHFIVDNWLDDEEMGAEVEDVDWNSIEPTVSNDDTNITNITNNTNMDNTNIQQNSLDIRNPSSPDKVLGEKTTRELLRELKSRGVEFGGISVPVIVRQEISLDEI